VRASIV